MSMSSCANSRKDGGGLMLSSQIMPHFIAKDEATGAPCSGVDVGYAGLAGNVGHRTLHRTEVSYHLALS